MSSAVLRSAYKFMAGNSINMAEAMRLGGRPITVAPATARKDYAAEFARILSSSANAAELGEMLRNPIVSDNLRNAILPGIEKAMEKGAGEALFEYYRGYRDTGNPIVNLHGKRASSLIDSASPADIRGLLAKCRALGAVFPDAADTMPELVMNMRRGMGGAFDTLTMAQLKEMVASTLKEAPDFCPKSIMRTMKAKVAKGDFRGIPQAALFRDNGQLLAPQPEKAADNAVLDIAGDRAVPEYSPPLPDASSSQISDTYIGVHKTRSPEIVKESNASAERSQEFCRMVPVAVAGIRVEIAMADTKSVLSHALSVPGKAVSARPAEMGCPAVPRMKADAAARPAAMTGAGRPVAAIEGRPADRERRPMIPLAPLRQAAAPATLIRIPAPARKEAGPSTQEKKTETARPSQPGRPASKHQALSSPRLRQGRVQRPSRTEPSKKSGAEAVVRLLRLAARAFSPRRRKRVGDKGIAPLPERKRTRKKRETDKIAPRKALPKPVRKTPLERRRSASEEVRQHKRKERRAVGPAGQSRAAPGRRRERTAIGRGRAVKPAARKAADTAAGPKVRMAAVRKARDAARAVLRHKRVRPFFKVRVPSLPHGLARYPRVPASIAASGARVRRLRELH